MHWGCTMLLPIQPGVFGKVSMKWMLFPTHGTKQSSGNNSDTMIGMLCTNCRGGIRSGGCEAKCTVSYKAQVKLLTLPCIHHISCHGNSSDWDVQMGEAGIVLWLLQKQHAPDCPYIFACPNLVAPGKFTLAINDRFC